MSLFAENTRGSYNVRDFGATGDGFTKDTRAIQAAIDACHREGGGMVLVPPGDYHTGPLQLRSNVNLHLESGSVLLGSEDIDDYYDWRSEKFHPGSAPYNARFLLVAEDAENISITGEGVIDGRGRAHYDCSEDGSAWWPVRDKKTRPGRMIMLALCRNVRIEGITCLNAPAWTFWVIGCETVAFHNVTIRTPYQAINTDGIDIDCCRNVRITHCDIRTGDDAIVLRAIDRVLKDKRPCEQIHVENCTLSSNCQAVRLSYLRDGVIRNVAMNNLTILDSKRGIICQVPSPGETPEKNFSAPLTPGPIIENITFTNIRINARVPIWFYISDTGCARRIANIRFENFVIQGSTPSVIRGNAETPLENVSFRNVRIQLVDGEPFPAAPQELRDQALALAGEHCRNLSLVNLTIEGGNALRDVSLPALHFNAVEGLEFNHLSNPSPHLSCSHDGAEKMEPATDFACQPAMPRSARFRQD